MRGIRIRSHVWPINGPSLGANGHHHCDIDEEDNRIWCWDSFAKHRLWGLPWTKNLPWESALAAELRALEGRHATNSDFVRKRDVVEWAVGVLREWGVIGSKGYRVRWDLGDDDPLATQELADVMRKRRFTDD